MAYLGTTIDLDVVGTPGGSTLGLLQPGFLIAGVSTLFGDLLLDPNRLIRDVPRPVDPATGFASWPLQIPADAALAGTLLHVQALSMSNNAPAGLAYTNMLSLRLVP